MQTPLYKVQSRIAELRGVNAVPKSVTVTSLWAAAAQYRQYMRFYQASGAGASSQTSTALQIQRCQKAWAARGFSLLVTYTTMKTCYLTISCSCFSSLSDSQWAPATSLSMRAAAQMRQVLCCALMHSSASTSQHDI